MADAGNLRAERLVEFCVAAELDCEAVRFDQALAYADARTEEWEASPRDQELPPRHQMVALYLLRQRLNDALAHRPARRKRADTKRRKPEMPKSARRCFEPLKPGRTVRPGDLLKYLSAIREVLEKDAPEQAKRLGSARSWADYIPSGSAAARPITSEVWSTIAAASPLLRAAAEALPAAIASRRATTIPPRLSAPSSVMPPDAEISEVWLLIFEHGRRQLMTLTTLDQMKRALIADLGVASAGCEPQGEWCCDGQETRIEANRWRYVLREPGPFGAGSAHFSMQIASDGLVWRPEWREEWRAAWGREPTSHEVAPANGVAFRLHRRALPPTGLRDSAPLQGSWLKLSAVGGTFVVTLAPDGTLTEQHALTPEPRSSGHWWVAGAPGPLSLHIWVGHWRVSLCEEGADLQVLSSIPTTHFSLPEPDPPLVRCLEEEPRLGRNTEFVMARIAEARAAAAP